MSVSVSRWVRLKKVLPPVLLISLAGLIGAIAGYYVIPRSGIATAIAIGWGFVIGLILGVLLVRRIVKE
jgi:zinc transporter ZupT